jgi:hypothetical protein
VQGRPAHFTTLRLHDSHISPCASYTYIETRLYPMVKCVDYKKVSSYDDQEGCQAEPRRTASQNVLKGHFPVRRRGTLFPREGGRDRAPRETGCLESQNGWRVVPPAVSWLRFWEATLYVSWAPRAMLWLRVAMPSHHGAVHRWQPAARASG